MDRNDMIQEFVKLFATRIEQDGVPKTMTALVAACSMLLASMPKSEEAAVIFCGQIEEMTAFLSLE